MTFLKFTSHLNIFNVITTYFDIIIMINLILILIKK